MVVILNVRLVEGHDIRVSWGVYLRHVPGEGGFSFSESRCIPLHDVHPGDVVESVPHPSFGLLEIRVEVDGT